MTYEEIVEIADSVFDEYMPKATAKTRTAFVNSFLAELEDRNAIEIVDSLPDEEDVQESEDDV